ncbi:MAG: heparin lyase I family protein, partial [Methylophilaceae bacterium]|nr:heparin lyase I family protein [Methylophilaceae bacterium]
RCIGVLKMNISKPSMVAGGFFLFALVAVPWNASSAPRRIAISEDGTVTDLSRPKKNAIAKTTESTTSDGTGEPTSTGTTSDTSLVTEPAASTTDSSTGYLATLSPTYTPREMTWAGRQWRVNAAATKFENMEHSLQHSSSWSKLRFEVRRDDPPMESNIEKRRSELSGSVYGDKTRLPNAVSLWGGFSTIHHSWNDPEGMKATWGGVYGQIHMGSPGGNPALAFRRRQDGTFLITSRSEFEASSVRRYHAELEWDKPHDIVYNVVLHPTNGRLKVWINGQIVVDYTGGIGHSAADHYWNFGLYFSKNVTSPVVAEYANHVYPGTKSLSTRIAGAPAWPSN